MEDVPPILILGIEVGKRVRSKDLDKLCLWNFPLPCVPEKEESRRETVFPNDFDVRTAVKQ
jgi:hypothetical protein